MSQGRLCVLISLVVSMAVPSAVTAEDGAWLRLAGGVPKDRAATAAKEGSWLALGTPAATPSAAPGGYKPVTLLDALAGQGGKLQEMTLSGQLSMADVKSSQAQSPMPLHTMEGVGGGAFVPVAYLVNPGPEGSVFGMPALSLRFAHLGHKKTVMAISVTETLFRRIEVGYSAIRLGLGTLPGAISNHYGAGAHIGEDAIWLHNFNLRVLLLEEGSFNLPLPAVTAGIHFKYNSTITEINGRVFGGGLGFIRFDKSAGIDYTLTATKVVLIPHLPPLVLTAGLRNTRAAHIGFAGFGKTCHTYFECSVATFLTEWLALSYEFRRKVSNVGPDFSRDVLGPESNWHAINVGVIVSENLTIGAGVAWLGQIGNTDGDGAWGLQIKYEF